MRLSAHRALLASGLLALWIPGVARAQRPLPFPQPVPSTQPKVARAPIPPGVPTTPENVYLPTEGEVRLGREGSAEVEKQYKLITSGPYYDRLQRVSKVVVAAIQSPEIIAEYKRVYHVPKPNDTARRVPFEFSFKILDTTKEVNAFSLPGGPVYVTKGLLDYATSDDELAGVLGHECTHTVFHHMEQEVKREKKVQTKQLFAMLGAIIAGAAGGPGAIEAASNIMIGTQLVSIAAMTGFGRELETEADRVGVLALRHTEYNPVGMLTFMQKLERDDRLRGYPNLSIWASHPYTNVRVATLEKQLKELGYRTDQGFQRQVSHAFRLEAVATRWNGQEAAEVRINGNLLFTAVAGEEDVTPLDRARKMAKRLEAMFDDNLKTGDVSLSQDRTAVVLKGVPVIRAYPQDGPAAATSDSPGTPEGAANRARNAILRALLQEQLNHS